MFFKNIIDFIFVLEIVDAKEMSSESSDDTEDEVDEKESPERNKEAATSKEEQDDASGKFYVVILAEKWFMYNFFVRIEMFSREYQNWIPWNYYVSDDDIGLGDDDGAAGDWLESIGLNKGKYRSLDPMKVKM